MMEEAEKAEDANADSVRVTCVTRVTERKKILCWVMEEELLVPIADQLGSPALIQQIPHSPENVLLEGEEHRTKRHERRNAYDNLQHILYEIQNLSKSSR